jgi:hypothetical protein
VGFGLVDGPKKSLSIYSEKLRIKVGLNLLSCDIVNKEMTENLAYFGLT